MSIGGPHEVLPPHGVTARCGLALSRLVDEVRAKREPQQTAAADIESRANCVEAIWPRGLRTAMDAHSRR